MLISSYNDNICPSSLTEDGDCCCNCIHRRILLVDGMPITFMCDTIMDGKRYLINIGRNGHSLCELHQRKGETPAEKLTIV